MSTSHPLPYDATLLHLPRPGGTIAVEFVGTGPLVVCIPGMGDLRSTFRHLVPALVASGHRVATMDLRGHGDSTAQFREYGDRATAGDVVALLDRLGEPAALVGNSMGAAAAVLAAAERPASARALILIGPFVRNTPTPLARRLAWRLAMARPWAARVWRMALPSLYAGTRPDDLAEHVARIAASMRRPGHAAAFARTTRTSHADAEQALGQVRPGTPALVVMGAADPDFADPAAEARWVADRLGADVVMVPEAGHYPQAQRPDVVGPAIVAVLDRIRSEHRDA